jgi:hypothetical protein
MPADALSRIARICEDQDRLASADLVEVNALASRYALPDAGTAAEEELMGEFLAAAEDRLTELENETAETAIGGAADA